jgi:hypothetical protein
MEEAFKELKSQFMHSFAELDLSPDGHLNKRPSPPRHRTAGRWIDDEYYVDDEQQLQLQQQSERRQRRQRRDETQYIEEEDEQDMDVRYVQPDYEYASMQSQPRPKTKSSSGMKKSTKKRKEQMYYDDPREEEYQYARQSQRNEFGQQDQLTLMRAKERGSKKGAQVRPKKKERASSTSRLLESTYARELHLEIARHDRLPMSTERLETYFGSACSMGPSFMPPSTLTSGRGSPVIRPVSRSVSPSSPSSRTAYLYAGPGSASPGPAQYSRHTDPGMDGPSPVRMARSLAFKSPYSVRAFEEYEPTSTTYSPRIQAVSPRAPRPAFSRSPRIGTWNPKSILPYKY